MFESYLRYRNYRFLKIAVGLVIAAIVLYAAHDPVDAPNGGTWLGYGLGTVAGGLVVWLAWLGIRKRQYNAQTANIRAWTSAHVYLGLSLILVATLHSGFQFGWNVHTLAYALMMLVIISGIYGIVVYSRYPRKMTANRGGLSPDEMLREVLEIDRDVLQASAAIGGKTHEAISRSVQSSQIGGSFWQQVRGIPDRKDASGSLIEQLKFDRNKERDPVADKKTTDTVAFMASQISKAVPDGDRSKLTAGSSDLPDHLKTLEKVIPKLARKRELLRRLNRDVTHRARMKVWLFIHIPATAALLAALAIHVFAVFWYW